jgi:dTDP-4-dehydrorhamnose 3,5-epimerase
MTEPKILLPDAWTSANEKGIGTIVRGPASKGLISGVVLDTLKLWPDDRGYFLEVARLGQGPAAHFDLKTTQISSALSYPGIIKAFHYHRHQTDLWAPCSGMLQVGLVDLRPDSPTFMQRNTLYVGTLNPLQILIPPGVGHGYKVIGEQAAVLVYMTNQHYNSDDEGRIAHNHAAINYDWELQHK